MSDEIDDLNATQLDQPALADAPAQTPADTTSEPTQDILPDPVPTPIPETTAAVNSLIDPPAIDYSALINREVFELNGDNVAQLHAALSENAPIIGVSGIGADVSTYSIEFTSAATEAQKDAAAEILRTWPQRSGILRKRDYNLQQLDAWFSSQIDAGYLTNFGFILGLKSDDITLLTGNYILAQAAANLGQPIPPIIDTTGQAQQIQDMQTLTLIMLEYGNYRSQLSEAYASKKAEILAATDTLLAAI